MKVRASTKVSGPPPTMAAAARAHRHASGQTTTRPAALAGSWSCRTSGALRSWKADALAREWHSESGRQQITEPARMPEPLAMIADYRRFGREAVGSAQRP